MIKKYLLLLLLLVVLCTGWGPLGCEGRISGYVIDSQNRAVNGVKVYLYIQTFKLMETVTDNSGAYAFENIVWGTYEIKATKEGYKESTIQVSLGESYSCQMEVPAIVLLYDNEVEIESVYEEFILAIGGDTEKLDEVLDDDFSMVFTGYEEIVCTKDNFSQNCPVPEGVDFTEISIEEADNTATMSISFKVTGKSETEWSSELEFRVNNAQAIPEWKITGWELELLDFKPASVPGKGWADSNGSIEYDEDIERYRWVCLLF